MTPTFRVLEVFRPTQRTGPILVGELSTGTVKVGARLVEVGQSAHAMKVVAVDMPTERSSSRGTLSVVITPDRGSALRAGLILEVFNDGG